MSATVLPAAVRISVPSLLLFLWLHCQLSITLLLLLFQLPALPTLDNITFFSTLSHSLSLSLLLSYACWLSFAVGNAVPPVLLLLLSLFLFLLCSIKLGSFASAYVCRCWRRCRRRRRQALPKAPSLAVRSGCVKWAVRVCVQCLLKYACVCVRVSKPHGSLAAFGCLAAASPSPSL